MSSCFCLNYFAANGIFNNFVCRQPSFHSILLYLGVCVNKHRLFSKIIRQRKIKQGVRKLTLTQLSALQLSLRKSGAVQLFLCASGIKSLHQWGMGDMKSYHCWISVTALHNLENHIYNRYNFGLLKPFVCSDSFCLQTHFSCPLYFKTISQFHWLS